MLIIYLYYILLFFPLFVNFYKKNTNLWYNMFRRRLLIMLRFVICEDNKNHLDRFCTIINKVMMPYNFEYKISKFTHYDEKVEEIINNKNEIKVYLLDIELPVVSGLEVASKIRENDLESVIIFITAHNEFRDDIFYSRLVDTDYIPKDSLWTDRFEDSIKYVIENLERSKMLSFEYNHNSYRIPYKNINYIKRYKVIKSALFIL